MVRNPTWLPPERFVELDVWREAGYGVVEDGESAVIGDLCWYTDPIGTATRVWPDIPAPNESPGPWKYLNPTHGERKAGESKPNSTSACRLLIFRKGYVEKDDSPPEPVLDLSSLGDSVTPSMMSSRYPGCGHRRLPGTSGTCRVCSVLYAGR